MARGGHCSLIFWEETKGGHKEVREICSRRGGDGKASGVGGGGVDLEQGRGGRGGRRAGCGGEGEEVILSGGVAEVGIHGGVGGEVFGDDDVLGESDGETGGGGGGGWGGQVDC